MTSMCKKKEKKKEKNDTVNKKEASSEGFEMLHLYWVDEMSIICRLPH